jgi:hypothetical protein
LARCPYCGESAPLGGRKTVTNAASLAAALRKLEARGLRPSYLAEGYGEAEWLHRYGHKDPSIANYPRNLVMPHFARAGEILRSARRDQQDVGSETSPGELSNGREPVTEARMITYKLGTEVETPESNLVSVLDCDDEVQWKTSDGGIVEPGDGDKFARLRVAYVSASGTQDVGEVADAFRIQDDDGGLLEPLGESYNDGELQVAYGEEIAEGNGIEGFIYFELTEGQHPAYGLFDCSLEEDGEGIWLRWKLERDSPGSQS